MATRTRQQLAGILRERKLEYLVLRPETLHEEEVGLFLIAAIDRSESDFCFVEAPAPVVVGLAVQAQRRVWTAKAATYILGHLPSKLAAKQVAVIERRLDMSSAALDMARAFLYPAPRATLIGVSGGAGQCGGAAVVAVVKKIEHDLACLVQIAEQRADLIPEAIAAASEEPEGSKFREESLAKDRQHLGDVLAEIRQVYPE